MEQDNGRSVPDGLSQAEPRVSALRASIPSAFFSPAVYLSCPICYGSRVAFGRECSTCADPDPAVARNVLERLRPDQMRFLRAFGHTLANQPVTGKEWDEYALCDLYLENDDGIDDPDGNGWLIPPTRLWFASSQASMRYGSLATFIRYNPLGLMVRECLMVGAGAMVAPASGIAARSDETAQQAQPKARARPDAQSSPEESQ